MLLRHPSPRPSHGHRIEDQVRSVRGPPQGRRRGRRDRWKRQGLRIHDMACMRIQSLRRRRRHQVTCVGVTHRRRRWLDGDRAVAHCSMLRRAGLRRHGCSRGHGCRSWHGAVPHSRVLRSASCLRSGRDGRRSGSWRRHRAVPHRSVLRRTSRPSRRRGRRRRNGGWWHRAVAHRSVFGRASRDR
jgi:hypothetical protein